MKTIFLGTPSIAVPFLEVLAQKSRVLEVVTNPDQPAGRGYELKEPPVKQATAKLKLSVSQPETLKTPAVLAHFQELKPDLALVVAYGKLLPKPILETARHGFLNVHFSLLPKYRGAAPIQWSLIHGEKETGVTLFWLDEGMDTGPIFIQKRIAIGSHDAESLREALVTLGVSALHEALDLIEKDKIVRTPQSGEASRAPMLSKDDGRIDWKRPPVEIVNLIRGTNPWPGAFLLYTLQGKALRLKIRHAEAATDVGTAREGTILDVASEGGIVVKCGQGSLKIMSVQPEGKKAMSSWDFWQGAHLKIGDTLE